jgi:hypothetical protein
VYIYNNVIIFFFVIIVKLDNKNLSISKMKALI